jgi:hypothetical protein
LGSGGDFVAPGKKVPKWVVSAFFCHTSPKRCQKTQFYTILNNLFSVPNPVINNFPEIPTLSQPPKKLPLCPIFNLEAGHHPHTEYTFIKIYHSGALEWGCTTGNATTVALSTKKTTSGKDSVIEGQPLLLFD